MSDLVTHTTSPWVGSGLLVRNEWSLMTSGPNTLLVLSEDKGFVWIVTTPSYVPSYPTSYRVTVSYSSVVLNFSQDLSSLPCRGNMVQKSIKHCSLVDTFIVGQSRRREILFWIERDICSGERTRTKIHRVVIFETKFRDERDNPDLSLGDAPPLGSKSPSYTVEIVFTVLSLFHCR